MNKTIAVLATLDTKGQESNYLREQIQKLGESALLIDMGVIGEPGTRTDISREELAAVGGTPLEDILKNPTRQDAAPIMVAGAIRIITKLIDESQIHAIICLGGTQGTTNCSQVLQALPYGFPKIMVSTIASGDTSPFVGIKDITMMFSVSDILGLNTFTCRILANAAGAACGMAQIDQPIRSEKRDRPLIGMTNLGVLTEGTMVALDLFKQAGYEVIVFHAVGSGGRAMEQMMKEGILGAVFDYALGEISDELFDGLRASGPERLTVAGKLGLPQVICPGGTEHIGLIVPPNEVPEKYSRHKYTFHTPIIFAPRLKGDEMVRVAKEITSRLADTKAKAYFIMPTKGVSRYSAEGMVLEDPESDEAFFNEIRSSLPGNFELIERETHAEDPVFVREAVELLISLIEAA
ncbi:MAG: Tm-1-like ATP-binding domain-containing protein [bacterium]|nr:Tm-1-like ATP-binding domain-containing protein [bacterium]